MQIAAPLDHELLPSLQWIEVATSFQIPSFHIVGLPSPEVAESRERIRAAVDASGFEFPRRRVVVNLSPASVRKRGTGIDLATALSILASQEKTDDLKLVAWGELGLDGTVKAAGQVMRTLYATWRAEIPYLLVPQEIYGRAMRFLELLSGAQIFQSAPPLVFPVHSLSDAWRICKSIKSETLQNPSFQEKQIHSDDLEKDSALLPLPPSLERVLCVAAAGFHHILLLGPKGAGKTHALEWLIHLMPHSNKKTGVEQILLNELNECIDPGLKQTLQSPFLDQVPTRRIGSQTRPAALTGGAYPNWIRPGEFSLAHGGLLIADELPEWPRDSRETLREPLESGRITLTRAAGTVVLPAQFALAANGNLCPCGGWPTNLPRPDLSDPDETVSFMPCHCPRSHRVRYLDRVSGPVFDRIDIVRIFSGAAPPQSKSPGLLPFQLKAKVKAVRAALEKNLGAPSGLVVPHELEKLLKENKKWKAALAQLKATSLRARHKYLRVALTLAHWDGCQEPSIAHFYEASCYRPERFGLRE